MKKVFLLFILAMCSFIGKLSAQSGEADYIVVLDNGSSIDDQTFTEMRLAASKFVEQVLTCNPKNRVSVVHYGNGIYNGVNSNFNPKIYIESDFTNEQTAATNIRRRLYFGDQFHESLLLIGNALDNAPTQGIVSPQKTLDFSPNNILYIVTFTDANRNTGANPINNSFLVNQIAPAFNTDEAFKYVTEFKQFRKAKFVIVHYTPTPNPSAQAAAAVISSIGGLYTGALENFTTDFDGGVIPRMYYNRTNGFSPYQSEVHIWGDIADSICSAPGWGTIDMLYEPSGCALNGMQAVNWNYTLPAGAALNGFKLEMINNQTGDIYPVDLSNIAQWSPNEYYNYLFPSDFGASTAAGAAGQYRFRIVMHYTFNGNNYAVSSLNNYPWFDYDIDLDCVVLRSSNSNESQPFFKLTPNPTNGVFKVVLDKNIESGTLNIMDISGNVVHNKIFTSTKEIDVNLTSQKEGVYIVKVISDKNEIYTQKLIKK